MQSLHSLASRKGIRTVSEQLGIASPVPYSVSVFLEAARIESVRLHLHRLLNNLKCRFLEGPFEMS
jgi:hypothetical protein